ncbi:putative mediator of RNA polymerase II transcription subunit 4-like [Apostichopus japonicus]|uniref:Putative mediator of RNA polymerase II transcription subunit 4-like n=1 Tax=Stichopus japonicus TaxID=307972 RepID=A0A2G8JYQ3_STIJA|nr:putative mediator of RNA polymerase II transcription subunit 4-like [Apostichopus japonicus]
MASNEKFASKSKLLSLVEEAEKLTRDLLDTTSTARQKIVHPDDPQHHNYLDYLSPILLDNIMCIAIYPKQGTTVPLGSCSLSYSRDPRRPYPTDLEIRMGILGRLSNLPVAPGSSAEGDPNSSSVDTWQPSSELSVSLHLASGISSTNGKGFELGQNKENEDVEVMSSDSESSSSSGSP